MVGQVDSMAVIPALSVTHFLKHIVTSLLCLFQENSPRDLEPAVDCIVLERRVILELVIEA